MAQPLSLADHGVIDIRHDHQTRYAGHSVCVNWYHARTRQATNRRADRARRPAEGARQAGPSSAIREHLEPRAPCRVGPPRHPHESHVVAGRQEARPCSDSNRPPRRRPTARVPRGSPGPGPQQTWDRSRRRSGSNGPPGCGEGEAARGRARQWTYRTHADRTRNLRTGRGTHGNPPRGTGDRHLVAVQEMPAMRLRVLRPIEERLGHMVCDGDLRQSNEESVLPPAQGGRSRPLTASSRGATSGTTSIRARANAPARLSDRHVVRQSGPAQAHRGRR
jgi:hypothetical protein